MHFIHVSLGASRGYACSAGQEHDNQMWGAAPAYARTAKHRGERVMQKRTLGNSNLEVSALGFGCTPPLHKKAAGGS
jgi:hypothetical protein